nr:unnamed protein product [Digitaria exilis]
MAYQQARSFPKGCCRSTLHPLTSTTPLVKAWKLSDGTYVDSFVAHDEPVSAKDSADGTVKGRQVYGGPCDYEAATLYGGQLRHLNAGRRPTATMSADVEDDGRPVRGGGVVGGPAAATTLGRDSCRGGGGRW